MQLVDCCVQSDEPPKNQPTRGKCPGCEGELSYEGQQGPLGDFGVAPPVVQFCLDLVQLFRW